MYNNEENYMYNHDLLDLPFEMTRKHIIVIKITKANTIVATMVSPSSPLSTVVSNML